MEVERGPIAEWQSWWRQCADECAGEPARELAAAQGFVIATRQLAGLGLSSNDARRWLRKRDWTAVAHGVLTPLVIVGDDHTSVRRRHVLASTAAALRRHDHVITGRSAAITYGLPTMAAPRRPVLTTAGVDAQGRRAGVDIRGASIDADAIRRWFGASVTTPARTLVDLARHDRRDAIMAADAALREHLVTWDEIAVELAGAAGWPGIRGARDVLQLATPLAESPLESLVRLALHDDDFPPPQLQVEIAGYRVDFLWPEQRLILEADGRVKYTGDELWREKKRETRLRALRYRVERVLWADVTVTWPETRRALWTALAA